MLFSSRFVFSNLIDRAAWSARVPRDSISASLISASLALSFHSAELISFPDFFSMGSLFQSDWLGRAVGWDDSRFDFRKVDFRFVGSIFFIPLNLTHFPFSFLWVRFFQSH